MDPGLKCAPYGRFLLPGLRGYHVYRTSWKSFLKQQLMFKQEKDNKHDRFAVAGQTILPGTIFLLVSDIFQ